MSCVLCYALGWIAQIEGESETTVIMINALLNSHELIARGKSTSLTTNDTAGDASCVQLTGLTAYLLSLSLICVLSRTKVRSVSSLDLFNVHLSILWTFNFSMSSVYGSYMCVVIVIVPCTHYPVNLIEQNTLL